MNKQRHFLKMFNLLKIRLENEKKDIKLFVELFPHYSQINL